MSMRAYIRAWVVAGLANLAALSHAEELIVLDAQASVGQTLAVASGGVLTLRLLPPAALKSSAIVADLWQVADAVALPLGRGESAAEEASAPDGRGVSTMRIAFPEVKRKTQVLVKFFAVQEPAVEIGRARVWIYPAVNWGPITRRFNDGNPRLIVFGESEALRVFLKRRGIEFVDQGESPPEGLDAGVVAVGALSAKAWREVKLRVAPEGGRWVVFVEDAAGLPGVYTTARGTGAITHVTLPVLGGLAEDPRAEDVFLQIIEQHLHSAPGAIF